MPSLASYAACDATSRGRRNKEPKPVYRSEYQRDKDRIIHSSAFRRLEYKTQVFVNHEGDMFRTRLTHSLEVAQIGRSIARCLNVNEDLTETIALAHDLGHTPFGHAGQDALNTCMQQFGGFEHNLQSLRIVDELEQRYAAFSGLNLTFESREGILKHCSMKKAALLGDVGQRFVNKHQPGLEAQLVNLADEIAYNNHDIDDGLRAELISIEQLCNIQLFYEQHEEVKSLYPQIAGRRLVHEIIRRMINKQVVDLVETSINELKRVAPQTIDDIRQHEGPLIQFGSQMLDMNQNLKRFLRKKLYRHYHVHRMSCKANHIIQGLFNAFMEDYHLLPTEHQTILKQHEDKNGRARTIADYIAGMTDRYAIAEYGRIFTPIELT